MQRSRLIDYRSSRGPTCIGLCQGDISKCAEQVNAAQQRLLFLSRQNDEGPWGTWAKVAFDVTKDDPFFTCPREVARLEQITVCNRPVRIQNQFYEFLDYGIGYQQPNQCCQYLEGYDRGTFPSFIDLNAGYKIRVYITDDSDVGKRALIQGTDTSDNTIYNQDGLSQVQGEYVTFASPFVETNAMNLLTGIQKDTTNGVVRFFMVNPDTDEQTLILTMEPSEKTASYRRYQIAGLPKNCCNPASDSTTAQVLALAKLDYIPVRVDTDYLLISNIEALIEETQAIRYESLDDPGASALASKHHANAVALLNGQLGHYMGKNRPASIVTPFGSARLYRQKIGSVI